MQHAAAIYVELSMSKQLGSMQLSCVSNYHHQNSWAACSCLVCEIFHVKPVRQHAAVMYVKVLIVKVIERHAAAMYIEISTIVKVGQHAVAMCVKVVIVKTAKQHAFALHVEVIPIKTVVQHAATLTFMQQPDTVSRVPLRAQLMPRSDLHRLGTSSNHVLGLF